MTTFLYLYGLQLAEAFVKTHDKNALLSPCIEELHSHAFRINNQNPKDWIISDNHELLPAWRIGYVKNEDEEKCFIDKAYTVLLDKERQRTYVVSHSYKDKTKYILRPMPANNPVTGEYLYFDSEKSGAPKRFSKPTIKVVQAWEDWCDHLSETYVLSLTKNAEQLRTRLEAFRKAVPDLCEIKDIHGNTTEFYFKRGFLHFHYHPSVETGQWYRQVSIHWQSVPTDEEILKQTKNK